MARARRGSPNGCPVTRSRAPSCATWSSSRSSVSSRPAIGRRRRYRASARRCSSAFSWRRLPRASWRCRPSRSRSRRAWPCGGRGAGGAPIPAARRRSSMPNTAAGTLEILALELAKALGPLAERLHDTHHARMLIAELGLVMPEQVVTPALENAIAAVHRGAHELGDEATTLKTAIDNENIGDIIVQGASLARTIATLIEAFDTIRGEI